MEIWKPVNGFDEHYAVSDLGNVRNLDTGSILTGDTNTMGYKRVILYYGKKCRFFVHRLVALHFCDGYAPDLVVNHIDGNKQNNRADNLEWVTRSANDRHAVRMGLKRPGNWVPVIWIDKGSGSVVRQYASISEAARTIGRASFVVQKFCENEYVDDNGILWKYA